MNDASDDAIAEALWGKVSDDLDSDAAHLALVEHFRGRGQLGEAARLYQEHQSALNPDGDDDAKAQIDKRLEAIAALAFAQLDVTRTEPKPRSLAINLLMVVVGLMCIAAVAGLLKALLP